MLSKFWFIITIVMGITYQSNSQIDSYSELQKKYEFYKTKNKLDSALILSKQMNNWALQNEADTSLRYAVSLRYIGNVFDKLRLVDSTLFYWDKSLEILVKQNRSDCLDAAHCYYNKGLFYANNKDYVKAIINLKNSLEIKVKVLGEKDLEVANCCQRIGIYYFNLRDNVNAVSYYKKALEIRKIALGEEHPDYANSLNSLGNLYHKLSNYKLAEHYYKQALEIRKKALGKEHPIYAESLNNLSVLYTDMGDYKTAENYNKQSLELFKKVLGEQHPDYASSLNNLGLLYSDMGDFKSAEQYCKQALEIRKKTLGVEHPNYASSLNNLGLLFANTGDYKVAEHYYKQSLQITKKALGEEHPDYANSLNNLGLLYANTGDYKAAESYYKQSLEIRKKVLGEEHPDYAKCLGNLGNLFYEMGDYKAAETYWKQSSEILKKVLGEQHPVYATSINNLGILYNRLRDYKAAERCYRQVLEIQKKALGEEHPDYASSLINLGNLFFAMGDYKNAEPYYKQSLEIRKKVFGEVHPDYAESLNNLGILYKKLGDYKAAEQNYEEALEIQKKALGEGHPIYAICLKNLGKMYADIGDFKSAVPLYKKALNVKLGNLNKNFLWLSVNEKQTYWQQEKDFYKYTNSFSVTAIDSVPSSAELAYNVNLIAKSLLLESSRELDQAIANSSDQLIKAEFTEMKQLRRIYSKMQSEGSNNKEIMDRYKFQADSLDKILVNKLGEYANAKRKFEIKWKDVQANLTPSEAAIEFARYYDNADSIYKYMALVVRPEYEYPKLVKLGSESNIKSSCSQREFSDLYNYVWRGIDSLLTDVKTIYYSPVGELNNVSFSALISENKTNNQLDSAKSNWSYLMDHYEFHQLTTTRYLADGTLKKNKEMPHSIKLIGGVNYTDLPILKDTINKEESNEDFALQLNLQKELNENQSKRGGKINYLKGSEIEVKDISKVLNAANWSISSSTGKNASEYQFKEELNKKSPGVLHIATHGFAFPEKEIKKDKEFPTPENTSYKISEDPMVRCGLMFSGANISWSGDSKKMIETTGDDGILTASEVANLDLSNTKLVVLSACETGLGKIESSEGTFGLKRGFKLAGVEQIIVSLWTVPDKETMELMTLFYSDLSKTKDPVVSFNKAQKEMRNRYPYEPEKWAGFVLVR